MTNHFSVYLPASAREPGARCAVELVTPTPIVLSTLLVPATTNAGGPFMKRTDLFDAETGGYALYRIPGIVVTPRPGPPSW